MKKFPPQYTLICAYTDKKETIIKTSFDFKKLKKLGHFMLVNDPKIFGIRNKMRIEDESGKIIFTEGL